MSPQEAAPCAPMRDPTPAKARKRITYSPRDLYFATYHQAAHAAVAVTLGCRVDYLEIGMVPEELGWCVDGTPSGDLETVCAAGFAMELELGRRHDSAWDHCKPDRILLTSSYDDRTGMAMDVAAGVERFMEGATLCRSILAHSAVRAVIDKLAEALGDAYLAGDERLERADVVAITDALTKSDVR